MGCHFSAPINPTTSNKKSLFRDGEVPGLDQKLCLPDITLPINTFSAMSQMLFDNRIKEDLKILSNVFKIDDHLAGKSKSDPKAMAGIYEVYIKHIIKRHERLPKNYLYFGNGKLLEILIELLKTNPFFTSALSYNTATNEYMINSFISDAVNQPTTIYSKLAKGYEATYPRVNISFDAATWQLKQLNVFLEGKDVTKDAKFSDQKKVLAYLLFSLCHYAEVVHATIHIYDLIMIVGMIHASEDSKLINSWADTYMRSVFLKYKEVEVLLFEKEEGALINDLWHCKYEVVIGVARDDCLLEWLSYDTVTDFVDKFLFARIPADKRRGILEEFLRHANLFPQFADEMTAAMHSSDPTGLGKTNSGLTNYMKEVSAKRPINGMNMTQWLHGMSFMNLIHGGTFSFTRLIAVPEIAALMTEKESKYTMTDEAHVMAMLLTTDGLQTNRYIFTGSLIEENRKDNPLIPILESYDAKANQLKKDYLAKLEENEESFREYGWIWNDFIPDLIDNRQLTLTTYV